MTRASSIGTGEAWLRWPSLCHCRAHRRREDSHQQGPGGVPEPPADRGGPSHRGVHHALHCQSQAGGLPLPVAQPWLHGSHCRVPKSVLPREFMLPVCMCLHRSLQGNQETALIPRTVPIFVQCNFTVACPLWWHCSHLVAWGQSKLIVLEGHDSLCLDVPNGWLPSIWELLRASPTLW